ncbi:MAG: AmpG family muropeptide MFS transporter, partial [Flavobacteriales bacterium]|nr:AmpG family muropeptide MFS transporter [Flavobacteriales bacterium]
MFVTFFMGMASGLPLLLTLSTLQAWMKDSQVDLTQIGLITLVGLPYSWKFVWAPIFDRYTLFFLGRRRGWLLVTQIGLMVTIALMSLLNPLNQITLLVIAAAGVAFLSASQDIVIDSYRREILNDDELGLGSSVYVYGYRTAMLISGAGSLIIADKFSWSTAYLFMALLFIPAILCTILAPEPKVESKPPQNFKETVVEPFVEFFKRNQSILILLFILLYKLGDTMASAMTMPFYLDMGFTKTEIGAVTKLFGFWATIIGTFLGGVLIIKLKINKSLLLFGFLQGISTAGFAILSIMGNSIGTLTGVIFFENVSGGMGTAAYMAFMAQNSNKKFTATQYALFTSLMGIPRTLLSSPTGYMAEKMGWTWFFIFCTVIAIPGLLLIRPLKNNSK